MQKNYQKCLETILHHEGGYVNHPKDPGGETNLGVTKRVYQEWGGTKADGGIGPNTLAKVNEYVNKFNVEHAINHYQNNRQKYYEELSTFDTFGKGWTRRVKETTELALELKGNSA